MRWPFPWQIALMICGCLMWAISACSAGPNSTPNQPPLTSSPAPQIDLARVDPCSLVASDVRQKLSLGRSERTPTGDGDDSQVCGFEQIGSVATKLFLFPREPPQALIARSANSEQTENTGSSREVTIGDSSAIEYRSTQRAYGHHTCLVAFAITPTGTVAIVRTDFRGDDVPFDELCEQARLMATSAQETLKTM